MLAENVGLSFRNLSSGIHLLTFLFGVFCVYFIVSFNASNKPMYLQVNALSEWIIGIYLHEFTENEREISIPHSAASCGIETFEFIVSERVQVNPDNSRQWVR